MYGFSTITRKGQIVIPALIRRQLRLLPSRRVSFEVKGDTVVLKPVMTIDEAYGMFKTNRHVTQEEMDKAIEEAVVEKYRTKVKQGRA